ncbi:MAG: bifunctional phosphopantothenoylcysteine decarboxylase/phosphopantothenate--cysteine ligase CoaBC [Chloroflexaceae bacterium]|nr:bifunctional phosphopantothenoylcysteine decarboxylase/phosphopantothenate--cysteine ligase CoaBC [Chloroflexaceae bacterium]
MQILNGKRIVLGVCGSIAAYKVAELARNLTLGGAIVDVVLTESAERFVGTATFQALTGRPVLTDMWALPEDSVVGHVALGVNADLIVIAPATANTLARLAAGMCDDLLTTTVLATTAPILCAPAMNVHMYAAAATQHNIATLRGRGFTVLEPAEGRMAEPMVGKGRLPEPAIIEGEIRALLGRTHGPLRGKKVVVTAGGTREPIDPIRYLSNRSSGQMGYALAAAARDAGAHVTLISTPVTLEAPAAMELVRVETAIQMRDAVQAACTGADLLVMNAAVADFRPAEVADQKIKKQGHAEGMTLNLVPNPDILGELAQRDDLFKVGFAAETQDLQHHAEGKLQRKRLDMIVANNATETMSQNDIEVTILTRNNDVIMMPRQSKEAAAVAILQTIIERLPRLPADRGAGHTE